MGFKHLRHADIDKALWDDLLQKCPNRLIYASSWWLDLVSPGWDALVDEEAGSLFPLPHRRKIFRYVYPPEFTQQLGLFSPTAHHTSKALLSVPGCFKYVELNLNESNTLLLPDGWQAEDKPNIILEIQSRSSEEIRRTYAQNHQRALAKDHAKLVRIRPLDDGRPVIKLFMDNKGKEIKTKESTAQLAGRIFSEGYARGCLKFYGAWLGESLLGAAVIADFNNRVTFLFSGLTEQGREMSAMFVLMDHLINLYAGTSRVFDFEGSSNPGLRRFYSGFGGREVVYLQVKRNRLPWPVNRLKK